MIKGPIQALHQESGSEYPDFPAQVSLDLVVLSLFIPFTSTAHAQGEVGSFSLFLILPSPSADFHKDPLVTLWWREGLSHKIPVQGPFLAWLGLTHSQPPVLCPLCSVEHLRGSAVVFVSLCTHTGHTTISPEPFRWVWANSDSSPMISAHLGEISPPRSEQSSFHPVHTPTSQIGRPKIFICNGFW